MLARPAAPSADGDHVDWASSDDGIALRLDHLMLIVLAGAAACAASPAPPARPPEAAAPPVSAQDAVERLLRSAHTSAEWFSPAFPVPVRAVDRILGAMKRALGPLLDVHVTGDSFDAGFERGNLGGRFELDTRGRFTCLDLDTPRGRH